ncbi:MAG: indole-3-glycerol-phosphate synthase [Euryarchaeota archaeon]|nr:indole-3-glycerol-phosphate synthase [Euryarchaeota archaeon]
MNNGDHVHSVVNNILTSTRDRVQQLGSENIPLLIRTTRKRDLIASITSARAKEHVPIIAEVKPASPGKAIRDLSPEMAASIAEDMERAGAAAISVLTEPHFFHGSIENLKQVRKNTSIPVLRKDFIIDELQMDEAESDMILLIAGVLGKRLDHFVSLTRSKGFQPLVEVHNMDELTNALATSAMIIGINNRNLSTLEIDLQTTEELIPFIREHDRINGCKHLVISESGVDTTDDVRRLMDAGADALLIGTTIMKEDDIYTRTKELVEALLQEDPR